MKEFDIGERLRFGGMVDSDGDIPIEFGVWINSDGFGGSTWNGTEYLNKDSAEKLIQHLQAVFDIGGK